jgi:hypothetical protein
MPVDLKDSVRLLKLANQKVGILPNDSIRELEHLTSRYVSRNDIRAARNVIAPLLLASDENFIERTKDPVNIGFQCNEYLTHFCDAPDVARYVEAVGALAQALQERDATFDRPKQMAQALIRNYGTQATWLGAGAITTAGIGVVAAPALLPAGIPIMLASAFVAWLTAPLSDAELAAGRVD